MVSSIFCGLSSYKLQMVGRHTVTLAQTGILMCLFAFNFDYLFYVGRDVALPKVRQRVNSGLGSGPGPLIQRQLYHPRGLGGSRLREWDLKA